MTSRVPTGYTYLGKTIYHEIYQRKPCEMFKENKKVTCAKNVAGELLFPPFLIYLNNQRKYVGAQSADGPHEELSDEARNVLLDKEGNLNPEFINFSDRPIYGGKRKSRRRRQRRLSKRQRTKTRKSRAKRHY